MKNIKKEDINSNNEWNTSQIKKNKDYCDNWFILPYIYPNFKWDKYGGIHSSLQLDHEYDIGCIDRDAMVYFLLTLYKTYMKEHPEFRESKNNKCSFLHSGDLTVQCDCKLCSKLWKMFDATHVKLLCKHCKMYHYLRKDIYDMNKDKYRKKQGKYNTLDYCYRCSNRLEIIATNKLKKFKVR